MRRTGDIEAHAIAVERVNLHGRELELPRRLQQTGERGGKAVVRFPVFPPVATAEPKVCGHPADTRLQLARAIDRVRQTVRAVELLPPRVIWAGEVDALEGRLGPRERGGEVVVVGRVNRY